MLIGGLSTLGANHAAKIFLLPFQSCLCTFNLIAIIMHQLLSMHRFLDAQGSSSDLTALIVTS